MKLEQKLRHWEDTVRDWFAKHKEKSQTHNHDIFILFLLFFYSTDGIHLRP